MDKKNIKMNVAIIILSLFVVGLTGYIVFDKVFLENTLIEDEKEQTIQDDNSSEEIKLKNIIEEQLWILFNIDKPVNKIKDIDNNSKLLLALSLLEDKYITNSNDISTAFVNISADKVEEYFNNSVIYNLGVKHENFDVYELSNDKTFYNANLESFSKSFLYYRRPSASKIENYEKNGNKYTISMNYLFSDSDVGFTSYHGNFNDAIDGTNTIVNAVDKNGEYIDAQKYLVSNYNNIKNKLTTYTYVFEMVNNKLVLIDYYIK